MIAWLNQKTLDALKPGAERYLVWDENITGLGVEIFPKKGKRSWHYRYSMNGKPDKIRIGGSEMTLEEAQIKVRALRKGLDEGIDPRFNEGLGGITMSVLCDKFEKEYFPTLKHNTSYNWAGRIKNHIRPRFGSMLVTKVKDTDIRKMMDDMAKIKPTANNVRSILISMFEWAIERGLRPKHSNPALEVSPYPSPKRQVYLKPDQYIPVFEAIDADDKAYLGAKLGLKFILLTGVRKGEVWGLEWGWFQGDRFIVPQEAHKTGATSGERVIHLSPVAQEIVALTPKIGHLVFMSPEKTKAWGIDPLWQRVREKLGIKHIRVHDCRHSFASTLINQKMTLAQIGPLLGHASIQTTRRYAHLEQSTIQEYAAEAAEILNAALKPKE